MVSSSSMDPSFSSGDILWIDKVSYGAIMPQRFSDIPLINIFTWIPLLRMKDRNINWGYRRFCGLSMPQIDDVVILKRQKHGNVSMLKRIKYKLRIGDKIDLKNIQKNKFLLELIEKDTNRDFVKSLISNNDSVYSLKNDYYFVTGDNSKNSLDSRNFGYISIKEIEGVALFRLF